MNESLRLELRADGYEDVKTSVVCPFHVATQLFKNKVKWNHQWLLRTLQPTDVARAIVEAIECGRSEVLLPNISTAIPALRFLPTCVYDGIHRLLGSDDSIIRNN